jgi:hypothetical protein
MRRLKRSLSSIQRLERQGQLNPVKVNGRLRYDLRELDDPALALAEEGAATDDGGVYALLRRPSALHEDALDCADGIANAGHAVREGCKVDEPVASRHRARGNVVLAGYCIHIGRRCAPPGHVAGGERQTGHVPGHPHPGHDVPRVIDENQATGSATVGQRLDQILKCFVSLGTSLYAAFNHKEAWCGMMRWVAQFLANAAP